MLLSQHGGHIQSAKFIRYAKDDTCTVIGVRNSNPLIDTRVKDVMFLYGSLQQYAANVITDEIYSQVDTEGY